jgi:hypothetical protein
MKKKPTSLNLLKKAVMPGLPGLIGKTMKGPIGVPVPIHSRYPNQLSLNFTDKPTPTTAYNKRMARALMIADGLIPALSNETFQEALNKMSPISRDRTKKRFRKAWRVAAKNKGLNMQSLSAKQKRDLVYKYYIDKAKVNK